MYVVDRAAPRRLAHLGYRTSTPFHWGGCTDGALELAFAILADVTHSRPTDLVCRAFCREVVARLDRAGFVLCHGDIALWLLTAFDDQPLHPPAPGRPTGLAHRAAQWIRAWVGRG